MGNQLDSFRSQSEAYFNNGSFISGARESSGSFSGKDSWRIPNLDKEAMLGVIDEDKLDDGQFEKDLSEKALEKKGILTHIEEIPFDKRKTRVMYGFLRKAGRGKIAIPHKRWCFLISARPLNKEDYLEDNEQISEDILPPLIDFDTVYYYEMNGSDDSSTYKGAIKCQDIGKIEMKSDGKWHSLVIDAGAKKYELMSETKYVVQQWMEAMQLSQRTFSERQMSLTGSMKNIARIVTEFEIDADELSDRLKSEAREMFPEDKEWKSLDELLDKANLLSKELFSIFDACLAQNPPRKDLIKLYMETQHTIMCEELSKFWEKNALNLGKSEGVFSQEIEIMSLCDWLYEYMKGLQRFGVSDDSIKNGFVSLCNSYKRKVHLRLYPLVTNVLILDKKSEPYEQNKRGKTILYTNGPKDVFKLFSEVLEVIQAKKLKDLTLRVLEVIHQILIQFQQAVLMMVKADSSLSTDYLIAVSNNCGAVYDYIQNIVEPIRKQNLCTEEELNKAFDERKIEQNSFEIIKEVMVKVSDTAYLQTRDFYTGDFLDMDFDEALHKSMGIYEELTDCMDASSSREAWKSFMKKSMAAYIQCLLNSSTKIKQKKSEEAISKISRDYENFENAFGEYMGKRAMRSSLEVIGDVKNFFESSPDFLSVSVEKMRNMHGPSFNSHTVKALLSLRQDMTSKEKAIVFKECKETLAQFTANDKGKSEGIFNNIDTKGAEAEFLADMTVKKEGEGDEEAHHEFIQEFKDDSDNEELDMEAFLREGGVDLDELDDQTRQTMINQQRKTVKQRDKVVEIKGQADMKGDLFLQQSSVDESSQIFGKIFSVVTDTVKMVADTVNKKRTKKYFAIKNKKLFIFKSSKSDKADEQIVIKDIEVLNYDEDSKKSFYFLYKREIYRMEAKNQQECEKWYKSIQLVMSMSEDYLNLDRFVDEKIFTKVTGKSLFKDYEIILEKERKRLWKIEQERIKAEEAKRLEAERKALEEEGKKKAARVAAKRSVAETLGFTKTKSENVVNKKPEEVKGDLPRHTNTVTNQAAFRTGQAQHPAKVSNTENKIEKQPVAPLMSAAPPRPDPEIVPESPRNDKDDTPLLLQNEASDAEDEEEYAGYGINKSKRQSTPLENRPSKHDEEMASIIALDNQRKESMYDIMIKREDSRKESAATSNTIGKATNEDGYDADRSRQASKPHASGPQKSLATDRTVSTFTPGGNTRTYVGEPVTTTSCFGNCYNWVLGLFRRN